MRKLNAIEGGTGNVTYHSVGGDNSAKKIQRVLDGIDISYASPESRYDMNLEGQKVLDLTDPKIAGEWGIFKRRIITS